MFETVNKIIVETIKLEETVFGSAIRILHPKLQLAWMLVGLNQLNDIKNQDFDHICFIGNYTNLFKTTHELLKIPNTVFRNLKNQVFLLKNDYSKMKSENINYKIDIKELKNGYKTLAGHKLSRVVLIGKSREKMKIQKNEI